MNEERRVCACLKACGYVLLPADAAKQARDFHVYLGPQTPMDADDFDFVFDRGVLPVRGLVRAPKGLFCGLVQNGQVVSWAVAGEPRQGLRPVTLETDRAFRGRSLGSAALRRLCAISDLPLLYICSVNNAASARAAEKAGFSFCGRARPAVPSERESPCF